MAVNAEMLVRVLYKTATKLQYYDFVLFSQHIAIMWKSLVDFPKMKMLRVLAYLFKYKSHFNKNWIFVAIYGIQKLRTKTCFSQALKVKTCFQAKNCNY